MTYVDSHFFAEERFALGRETDTGRYYASFPVSNGVVDYEEYCEITAEQYCDFVSDREAALNFIESCRRRERDDVLMVQPGWNRGTPT